MLQGRLRLLRGRTVGRTEGHTQGCRDIIFPPCSAERRSLREKTEMEGKLGRAIPSKRGVRSSVSLSRGSTLGRFLSPFQRRRGRGGGRSRGGLSRRRILFGKRIPMTSPRGRRTLRDADAVEKQRRPEVAHFLFHPGKTSSD